MSRNVLSVTARRRAVVKDSTSRTSRVPRPRRPCWGSTSTSSRWRCGPKSFTKAKPTGSPAPRGRWVSSSPPRSSDRPLDLRKAPPHGHAAKVLALGAGGRDAAGAQNAGRPHVPGEARMDAAHLLELVHRGSVDLLLRVEAGPHDPLVGQVQERPALVEAQGRRVGQKVERFLE